MLYTYKVIFYIDNIPIEGGEVIFKACDFTEALQVLNLKLNTKQGIPSIWNSYSEPIEIHCS